ncbi:LacI family DNA-binding transcriptional regulator [Allosphingosinicella flava]|uniref:LacI family DNA-binding transcriptional regulator n=1 Tax=Allosphingosinicella flava TaxID=2771430 RepID=A0A7T2GI93_9SPHN|nr:LacI family DNA-binding transcriptional regulator [Sphingosinicella flava]QPQ54358.1 LacI family DNA-binding transcriptional regulator [Sphingosinicella flava]
MNNRAALEERHTGAPRTRQTVTIKHVAAEAGVSLQTVSRVINNGPNVTPVVRERVQAAVAKLGYFPNLAARRLGGSRSYLLMALNDREPTVAGWREGRGNDWIDQMLLGGMLTCAEHGYRMIFELVDSHSDKMVDQIQAALSALRPDGVILTPPHTENAAIADILLRNGVPFARLGSRTEGEGLSIAMNDALAAATAVDHLAELGHKRIGFITGSRDYLASIDRLAGYRGAMDRHGLFDPALVAEGDFGYASAVQAFETLSAIQSPPTAIIASSGEMALAVLAMARKLDIPVPEALSIVSFDDTPTVRMSAPPLTAIHQPIAGMTSLAAEMLIQIKDGRSDLSSGQILPFEFVVRGSTGPCRS